MPRLVRLYLFSILVGIVLGLGFTALLLGFDVAGLRRLLTGSVGGWIGLAMLAFFHSVLFSGVQFGVAVMLMAEGRTRPPRGRRRTAAARLALAASPARPADPAQPSG